MASPARLRLVAQAENSEEYVSRSSGQNTTSGISNISLKELLIQGGSTRQSEK